MREKIVLIGGGGHAKVIIELIKSQKMYDIIGICDNQKSKVLDIPIIGTDEYLPELYQQGVKQAFICIGSIGNPKKRWDLYKNLKKIGYQLPCLIHPSAIVSSRVTLGEGTCVMPGAIINVDTHIGRMGIINTGSIVEHDCQIDDNVHISPGACLCGGVKIGQHTHIGAKAVVNQGITITNHVIVGSGSVVINDVLTQSIIVGNPAHTLTKDKV